MYLYGCSFCSPDGGLKQNYWLNFAVLGIMLLAVRALFFLRISFTKAGRYLLYVRRVNIYVTFSVCLNLPSSLIVRVTFIEDTK